MIWTGVKKNETFFALGSVIGFLLLPPTDGGGAKRVFREGYVINLVWEVGQQDFDTLFR